MSKLCHYASNELRWANICAPDSGRRHSHLWQNIRWTLRMPWTRNRNAWMWVAIAAVAFTSVARAESRQQNVKAFAHPVLELLARSHAQNPAALSGVSRFAHLSSRLQARTMLRDAGSGALIAILPVLFIGLVAPGTLVSLASIRCLARAPAVPLLSALFQRPPPCLA